MKALATGTILFGVLVSSGCLELHSARPRLSESSVQCQSRDTGFENPIERALRLADTASQRAFHLSRFDSSNVKLVNDVALCTRISRLLGPVENGTDVAGRTRPRYSDIVAVQLGNAGYLVYAYWHVSDAGEFHCDVALVDPKLQKAMWLCG
jgi:hypothetical protein